MHRILIHCKTAAILTGFMLLLIACNLGTSSSAPPTLAPLPTLTPQATLGYVAARPVVVPEIGVTPLPPSDEAMRQILDQVESDRLMSHIRSLQDVRTRHILSTQSSATHGIGAARKYIKDQLEIFRSASGGKLYPFELSFEAYFSQDEAADEAIQYRRRYQRHGAKCGHYHRRRPLRQYRNTSRFGHGVCAWRQ